MRKNNRSSFNAQHKKHTHKTYRELNGHTSISLIHHNVAMQVDGACTSNKHVGSGQNLSDTALTTIHCSTVLTLLPSKPDTCYIITKSTSRSSVSANNISSTGTQRRPANNPALQCEPFPNTPKCAQRDHQPSMCCYRYGTSNEGMTIPPVCSYYSDKTACFPCPPACRSITRDNGT